MQGTIHFGHSPAASYLSVDRSMVRRLRRFLMATGRSPVRTFIRRDQAMVMFAPNDGELHQLPRRFREFCISNEAAR